MCLLYKEYLQNISDKSNLSQNSKKIQFYNLQNYSKIMKCQDKLLDSEERVFETRQRSNYLAII